MYSCTLIFVRAMLLKIEIVVVAKNRKDWHARATHAEFKSEGKS